MAKDPKFKVGQHVQISPKANTKNAGKYGTVKRIIPATGGYWGNNYISYVIDLGEGKTAELMERNVLKVEGAEIPKKEEKLEKLYFVISTDGKFISDPQTFAGAVTMAKEKQLSTPDCPEYYVAKVISKTTKPKVVVDMVSI